MDYSLYLTGPDYYPEELASMNYLYDYLRNAGFTVRSSSEHGLQRIVMDFCIAEQNSDAFYSIYRQACLLAFSLEYFHLLSADACIGFLNGRVPDESTIIKMGIAFGTGIPVIQYKFDPRILFPNGLNTMISGLTGDFSLVKKIDQLPKIIAKKNAAHNKRPLSEILQNLPPQNHAIYTLGEEVEQYLHQNGIKEMKSLSIDPLKTLINSFQNKLSESNLLNVNKKRTGEPQNVDPLGKVYCSGPLFCPEEVRDMKNIATSLEKSGFQTYLPQRDGGEPFVIGQIDNPFAGSPISKPIVGFLNRVLFAIDIYEIVKCDYFVINLNGRVPDDGAMAELGVAFAAGKPIVLYKNDIRSFYTGQLHPTLEAVAIYNPIVSSYENIPSAFMQIRNSMKDLGPNGYLQNLPNSIHPVYKYGKKWETRIKRFKVPKNEMELWNTREV